MVRESTSKPQSLPVTSRPIAPVSKAFGNCRRMDESLQADTARMAGFGTNRSDACPSVVPKKCPFNVTVAPRRFAHIALALGASTEGSDEQQAMAGADLVRTLRAAVGLPERLREVGIPEEGLERIGEEAVLDGAIFFNPREASEDDLLALVRACY